MEVMGAFANDMEAFMEATSTEASMEDMEDMKASTDVTSTGASTKASTKASMEVTSMKAYMEAFVELLKAFAENMKLSWKRLPRKLPPT